MGVTIPNYAMLYPNLACIYPCSMFVQTQFLPWPSTGLVLYVSGCFTRQILPIQLAAKPGWCCRTTLCNGLTRTYSIASFSHRLPYRIRCKPVWLSKSVLLHLTRDFCHAGPLPVDPIKIYSCNVTSLRTPRHTSNIWFNIGATWFTGLQPQKRTGFTVSWIQRSG